jgi:hypothetical protein
LKDKSMPVGKIGAIREALEPTETLYAIARLSVPSDQLIEASIDAVVTDRFVHVMQISGNQRIGYSLSSHSQVPLTAITAMSTRQKGSRIEISFFWENYHEVFVSKRGLLDEATNLANHLKRLLSTKEAQSAAFSISDELSKLSQLSQEGILTEQELARAKGMLIGKEPNHIDQSIELLRSIKSLQKQGILSESEFNMKKWDILSKREFQ